MKTKRQEANARKHQVSLAVPLVPEDGRIVSTQVPVLRAATQTKERSSMNEPTKPPTQGPIQMTKDEAVQLSDFADDLTHYVEQQIRLRTSNPLIQQELRRVIGIQLIEAKYGAGRNTERFGDDPER